LDPVQIAQLIGELEERVERLRALYEQYFMGIERLEPLTLRKEVDRRLWALRREQIRNTGMRFKLETTIQRYNTYQQYWQRIVREIENGTYQRDLGRAAQRFGENAVTAFAKRRQKMFEKGQAKRAERDAMRRGQSSIPPPQNEVQDDAASSESFDVTFDDSDISETPFDNAPLLLDLASGESSKPFPAAPVAPARTPAPRPAPSSVTTEPTSGGQPPAPPPAPAKRPSIRPPRPPAPTAPRAPRPLLTDVATSPGMAPPLPNPVPPPARAPAASRPDDATSPTARAALPSQPKIKPPAPSAPAHEPGAPTQPNVGRPAPSRPDARASAQGQPDDQLSPARMRQIYGQYVDAKRKANESTAAITFEKVAANLRETATQLRAKGKGTVDFEVVMKNGKPVLKPVVKG
jgi:hypothetical protein